MSRPALTVANVQELDWAAAREAAQRIIKRCDSAGFTAPEAIDVIQASIASVCCELDAIVKALKITPPRKSP